MILRKINDKYFSVQGSHLGPLHFSSFINDVFSCFKSLWTLLYADDLNIFSPVAGNSDFANVQAELDVFFLSGASTAGYSLTWESVRA
jgi:hypothetical protein